MTCRMPCATGRPHRSARKIMTFRRVALPRSGAPAHCAPLARGPAEVSTGRAVIMRLVGRDRGHEHPMGDGLSRTRDAEADRAIRQRLVLEGQRFTRAHRLHELRRADPPAYPGVA